RVGARVGDVAEHLGGGVVVVVVDDLDLRRLVGQRLSGVEVEAEQLGAGLLDLEAWIAAGGLGSACVPAELAEAIAGGSDEESLVRAGLADKGLGVGGVPGLEGGLGLTQGLTAAGAPGQGGGVVVEEPRQLLLLGRAEVGAALAGLAEEGLRGLVVAAPLG